LTEIIPPCNQIIGNPRETIQIADQYPSGVFAASDWFDQLAAGKRP